LVNFNQGILFVIKTKIKFNFLKNCVKIITGHTPNKSKIWLNTIQISPHLKEKSILWQKFLSFFSPYLRLFTTILNIL
jgi:hypothetical protein